MTEEEEQPPTEATEPEIEADGNQVENSTPGEEPVLENEQEGEPQGADEDESQPPETVNENEETLTRQGSVRSQKSVTWSTADSDKILIDESDPAEKKRKQNCCVAIIAGMWASREMLKDNKDQQLFVKITLRELFVYLIFLFIISYATFSPYSPYNYQLTSQISQIFPTSPQTTNISHFWINYFVQDVTGAGGMFWETWYNQGMTNAYIQCPDGTLATQACATSLADRGILYENRLLGLPRLRQLKVRNDSCVVPPDFKSAIKVCYAPYKPAYEDTRSFVPSFRKYTSIDAWTYKSADELGGTSYWGEMGHYSGGGYTQNFHQSLNETQAILAELQRGKWIDQGTRFVTFDFTVYNANVNLFCIVKLYFEVPATGGMYPVQEYTTVKLLKYTTTGDYALMACEAAFCLFILYYIIEESLEFKVHGIAYFFNFWNILDIGVIAISLAQIALNAFNLMVIGGKLETLIHKPFEFADFSSLGKTSRILTQISAFNIFVAWIKLFKYLSFNKTMIQLSGTLSSAAKDLGGFSVMFFIIYFAFVQLGYLLFGVQCNDFRTFTDSVFTMFRMTLGDFNFKAIEQANTFLGPVFFLAYIFFVFFVLLNMFLAIINDTYGVVKAEVNAAKADFQMGDFFKTGSNNVKTYLGIHDRAVDVENAVKIAAGDDGFVTYQDLRENLRRARFSDIEIDIFFYHFKNDPTMSQMMLDEEEVKLRQAEKDKRKLSRAGMSEREAAMQRRLSRKMSLTEPVLGMPETIKEEASDDDDDDTPKSARPLSGRDARRARSAEIRAAALADQPVEDEEFYTLQARVDKMESSIIPLGHKIDLMLARLEVVFKERKITKNDMEKIFDGIVNNPDGVSG